MDEIKISKISDLPISKKEHDDYTFTKRKFISKSEKKGCVVEVYEIPPKKSMCPYHYHLKNEEVFFIISGSGILITPDGKKNISGGDLVYFPANEKGAHKIYNNSEDTNLLYIDFDTHNDIDVAIYPDSKKIGVWGKNVNKLFKENDDVDYFEGE